jgi:class I fructose-bisphosphate aldolase
MSDRIREMPGAAADDLLQHRCVTVPKESLHLPGPMFLDEIVTVSDRPTRVLRNLQSILDQGRVPLINSGGPSGANDLPQAVRTAVINKRAGGTGLITGRKAFQRSLKEGVELLNAVQDVYLDEEVTIA